MEKLTEEQAIVLTGFTDTLMVDFSKFHADLEKRLGHPVMPHQFPALRVEIREAYRADFMRLVSAE